MLLFESKPLVYLFDAGLRHADGEFVFWFRVGRVSERKRALIN